jgi:hypothetical protein
MPTRKGITPREAMVIDVGRRPAVLLPARSAKLVRRCLNVLLQRWYGQAQSDLPLLVAVCCKRKYETGTVALRRPSQGMKLVRLKGGLNSVNRYSCVARPTVEVCKVRFCCVSLLASLIR